MIVLFVRFFFFFFVHDEIDGRFFVSVQFVDRESSMVVWVLARYIGGSLVCFDSKKLSEKLKTSAITKKDGGMLS